MREFRRQRIRDPLHNLVEFEADEFHNVMWRVLQTKPFQRLRRIRQLGFSEFVYPGATHSRFAHSVGVFHTARLLMQVVERHLRKGNHYLESKAHRALAAALVHDVGHGPFSHAFEAVGKRFKLRNAKHENLSDAIIRDSEISEVLNEIGTGFAADVADVVKSKAPRHIYDTVVSSQFDADRLDYMRRDRLMTGTQHAGIDFEWLLANLEIGEVPTGVDEEPTGKSETLVLGPKAVFAAEAYVLGLFQLYPTVYFHKTTRGFEKVFTELLSRILFLTMDGGQRETGLGVNHPLIRFAKEPDRLDRIMDLDDTSIWGALYSLENARDYSISNLASRIRNRNALRCYDVLQRFERIFDASVDERFRNRSKRLGILEEAKVRIGDDVLAWNKRKGSTTPRVIVDEDERSPYRQLQESKGPLNQILIRLSKDTKPVDLGNRSAAVAAIESFQVFRIYCSRDDDESVAFIEKLLSREETHVEKRWAKN